MLFRSAALKVPSGPCGAAGLAAARKLLGSGGIAGARKHLGITEDSVILLLITEGSDANPLEER